MRNLCADHNNRVTKMSQLLGFNLEAVIVKKTQCEECVFDAQSKRLSRRKAGFIGGGKVV